MSELLTGGCQCGKVRFEVSKIGRASICHCRMCQKAFGGFFGPLVEVKDARFTTGLPKYFQSSNMAKRGFCEHCGTPLTYETKFGLEFAIGAFDDPTKVAPTIQVNLNDKLAFFDDLTSLPAKNNPSPQWLDFLAKVQSYQYPNENRKLKQIEKSNDAP